jgi:hypothetical protein
MQNSQGEGNGDDFLEMVAVPDNPVGWLGGG